MASKTCSYWDCDVAIKDNHFACRDHWEASLEGDLDKCPNCDDLKSAAYELCRPCEVKKSPGIAESRTPYETGASPAWAAGDEGVDAFYAYILKIDPTTTDNRIFYAGQTRNLRIRMTEHRDGSGPKSTKDRNPRLIWFTELPTRETAMEVEVELKNLIARNPREVRKLAMAFQDLIKDVEGL
ncbi:MAG: GIY-YIG nuclease family protein [Chloroflexi bacterium]|nr:GIY-YIG nuclease family protein [Chloroflexota bacterium]